MVWAENRTDRIFLRSSRMSKFSILQKMGMILALVVVAGCDCSKKLQTAQQQNQMLTQRVAELEAQLEQASAAAAEVPAPKSRSLYLVVEGDSLWKIAEKQLGSGNRHKEILALNPGLSKDTSLAIGTELILPAK
jgi:Tfp pilus assembly protein FimV